MTSGGLVLHIPLASYPQRGNLDLSFFVRFSSKQWWVKPPKFDSLGHIITPASWQQMGNSGTQIVSSVDWWIQNGLHLDSDSGTVWSRGVTSPDGNTHQLGGGTGTAFYPLRSHDASGILHPDLHTIVLPNGTRYAYPNFTENQSTGPGLSVYKAGIQAISVTDANGNQITLGANGWTDTLGRVIPGQAPGTNAPVQPGVPTTDLSSCPTGTSSAWVWNTPGVAGVNGGIRTFTFCYSTVALQTSFGQTGVDEYTGNVPLLTAVVLPDLTMWTFAYNSYGDVTRLGFPTGGAISYTYMTGPLTCTSTQRSRWIQSRTVDANDGTGPHTWIYQFSGQVTAPPGGWVYSGQAIVTSPDGNDTVHTIVSPVPGAYCSSFETQVDYYQGSHTNGTILKTVATQYSGIQDFFTVDGDGRNAANVLPLQVTTTLGNGPSSKTVDTWDSGTTLANGFQASFGKLMQHDEYDFSNALIRSELHHYLWQDNGSYQTNNFLSLKASSTTKNGAGQQVARATYSYDQSTPLSSGVGGPTHVSPPAGEPYRGNLTTEGHWLSTNNTYISNTATYLDTGMKAATTDPLGHQTTYTYSLGFLGAYLTQTNLPDTGVVHHVIGANYDFNTGLLTSFTDQNNQTYTYQYDNMLRMTQANHPDGGQTLFSFPNATTVDRQRLISTGVYDDYKVLFDGLGRPVESQHPTPAGTVLVDTTYDSVGRVASVSNPYYQGTNHASDPTYGTLQTQYDALGRPLQITKQDGSVSILSYAGSCSTATDEAGKARKVCLDALGRLINVWEDPAGLNYESDYQWDVLGNLLRVDQKGSAPSDSTQWRTRTFSYDSLSRTLTANSLESGQISYQYNDDNEITSKTDARGVTVSYTYDSLHRLLTKSYSDLTPGASLFYDETSPWGSALTNTVGRLSRIGTSNTGRVLSYDAMGRVVKQWECVPSNCGTSSYSSTAQYDLLGDLTQLTYPSGRVVTYGYNSAALLNNVTFLSWNGTAPSGGPYSYWSAADSNFYPSGAPISVTLGNGVTETNQLNQRLQLLEKTVAQPAVGSYSDRVYGYGTQNNGNIASVTDQLNSARTQNYSYDSLNRLAAAAESRWGLAFVYDAWGNNLQQNVTAGSAYQHQYTVNAKNQLTGFTYDTAGNMLNDGSHAYAFDAENRIKTVDSTAATYTYDGNGDRVRKDVGPASTEYVRFASNIIAERNVSTGDWSDYIFAGGKRTARALALDKGLRIYGTRCSSCGAQYSLFYLQNAGGLANYTIRSGDKLNLTQYQASGSHGGIVLAFTDGTNTNWHLKDQDGYNANDDPTQTNTHVRKFDLSGYAGKTIQAVALNQESDTAGGAFAIIYEQAVLLSADGTVQPIYTGESSSPVSSITATSGVTGTGSRIDINRNKAIYPLPTTTYYHSSQIGSSTMITAGYGWPVWQATYLPYGEEYNPELTDGEHYKFTGKERDAESGLDNFGARYYQSALGRFIGVDPLNSTHALKSLLSNPQNLNGYQYAHNDPTLKSDMGGLLTIIVPGTWYKTSDWNDNSAFVKGVGKTFGEKPVILHWNGALDPATGKGRAMAAVALANKINGYTFKPGEKLNIVTHSHGGNIAMQAAGDVLKHKIDNAVFLGKPMEIYSRYPNMKNISNVVNVYSDHDLVQWVACSAAFENCRTLAAQPGVTNVDASADAGGHSELWQNPDVWNHDVVPHLRGSDPENSAFPLDSGYSVAPDVGASTGLIRCRGGECRQ